MSRQKNKILFFNQAWATEFLSKKIKKYWPESKTLISLKIEPIKIFLNYLRFTLRYRVLIKTASGKIKEKKIIVKVEKPKKFIWPPRIGRVQKDFLATRFLWKKGLTDIVPRPLEFIPSHIAYLYEEADGEILKNFIQKDNWQINHFYKKIPSVIKALKKIHAIKIKPSYVKTNPKKTLEDGMENWLRIIKKYYPPGEKEATSIFLRLKKIKQKYKNYLFNQKSYCVTHGDFQNDNVVVGKGKKIIFIDFADSQFFNPFDDLASFLVQSELHFKYVKPKSYKQLTKKLKNIVLNAYFGKKIKPEDEFQINFFAIKDILRIITFVSFTQKHWQTVRAHSEMMESLLLFAKEKIKILEKQVL